MDMLSLEQELSQNAYPGRGIVIGKTSDGKSAVTAYFIMGRSSNSRNANATFFKRPLPTYAPYIYMMRQVKNMTHGTSSTFFRFIPRLLYMTDSPAL